MGLTLIIFAVAIGYGTFIENDFDAVTAKVLVYNAKWFEILLLLMVINFLGMIFTKKLYIKSRLNILVIHLALILIIAGAALTRYIGFEGQMHIRNGQTTNEFVSSDIYFNVKLNKGESSISDSKKVLLSSLGPKIFEKSYSIAGKSINVSIEKYYPNAVETLVNDNEGSSFVNIVAGGADGRHDFYIKEGDTKILHETKISFGDTTQKDAIQIVSKNGALHVRFPGWETDTSGLDSEGFQPCKPMNVFSYKGMSFIVKEFKENSSIKFINNPDPESSGQQIAKLKINDNNLDLKMIEPQTINVNGVDVEVSISKKIMQLPFLLKLNKFRLQRYPGSNSPSSYASDIMLIDKENNIERPYSIFMNNILEYGGFRFYQSSYDPDEQGTILSVNHDYWGTLVTYIGYFMLFASLIFSFFTPKTRFARITQQLKEIRKRRNGLMQIVVLIASLLMANIVNGQEHTASVAIDKEHAALFGKLLVQTQDGRIVPFNTLANQVLVKIYKKNRYQGLTPEQVFLGMIADPMEWQQKPMIKIKDEGIRSFLGINEEYGKFYEFFDDQGHYKLKEQVEKAYMKKPVLRSKYDKELISVDERMNVYFLALNKNYLKIFPIPEHPLNKWITPIEAAQMESTIDLGIDSLFTTYIDNLKESIVSKDYTKTNAALAKMSEYQKLYGAEIIPPETKTILEVFYNKANIFNRLFPIYLFIGLILVGIFFAGVFKPTLQFVLIKKILTSILFIAFIVQTTGLVLRWHISGHAPWSNGYESMIYISWATMLAGFFLAKKSPSTLSISAVLAGITLLTAHMSWMDPEITNLVPVLKSYWLTIHVATITASYGFLGL
ncbi:MAG: cytochrome c biogenesis protein ResB, partial [Fidelibacterota bacterium]